MQDSFHIRYLAATSTNNEQLNYGLYQRLYYKLGEILDDWLILTQNNQVPR